MYSIQTKCQRAHVLRNFSESNKQIEFQLKIRNAVQPPRIPVIKAQFLYNFTFVLSTCNVSFENQARKKHSPGHPTPTASPTALVGTLLDTCYINQIKQKIRLFSTPCHAFIVPIITTNHMIFIEQNFIKQQLGLKSINN